MTRLQGFVLTVNRMVRCTYHLKPPAAISIYGWKYQGTREVWAAKLVSPEDTTFYFTTKTTSPLCKLLEDKLQECIAASSMQAIFQYIYFNSFIT